MPNAPKPRTGHAKMECPKTAYLHQGRTERCPRVYISSSGWGEPTCRAVACVFVPEGRSTREQFPFRGVSHGCSREAVFVATRPATNRRETRMVAKTQSPDSALSAHHTPCGLRKINGIHNLPRHNLRDGYLLDRSWGSHSGRRPSRSSSEALVYRSHRVLYSPVSCGVRPNGPRVLLN
jgi:hypothetical protein